MQSETSNIAVGKLSLEFSSSNAESISLTNRQSLTVLPTPSTNLEYVANAPTENAEKGYRDSALSMTNLYYNFIHGDELVTASQGSLTAERWRPIGNLAGPLDEISSSAVSNLQDHEWQIRAITSGSSKETSKGYTTGFCVGILDRSVLAFSGQYSFNPIEVARLKLVRHAIIEQDCFFFTNVSL